MTDTTRRRFVQISCLVTAGIGGCSSQSTTDTESPPNTAEETETATTGLREDLVVQYRFEGDLTDATGEYDLSGSGVSYVDGPEGAQASSWNGYASTAYEPIDSDEPLTFCFWLRDNDTVSTWDDDLMWKIEATDGDGVGSFCASNGEPFLFTTGDNTLGETTTDVLDSEWHHIAFVYQQSENRMQLYVDGTPEYEILYTDNLTGMSDTELMFGNLDDDGFKEYDGGLDDFRIYRRALSGSEIRQLAEV